jgi:hypothetical protein
MSEAIPIELASIAEAIREIGAELSREGGLTSSGSRRWTYDLGIRDEAVEHASLLLDGSESLLCLFVVLRLSVKRQMLTPLAVAMCRANFGLLSGCFEVDFSSGEVRFRDSRWIGGGSFSTKELSAFVSNTLRMATAYQPAFESVLRGADPIETIDQFES